MRCSLLFLRFRSAGFVYGLLISEPLVVLGVGVIFAPNMDILNTISLRFRSVSSGINQSYRGFILGLAYAYRGGFDKMHDFIDKGIVNSGF